MTDEFDLFRPDLDDTMRLAFQEMEEERHTNDNVQDLRMAAYVIAIHKIAPAYLDMGY